MKCDVARNHWAGVYVTGLSQADLDTVHITDNLPAPCNNGVCLTGYPGGAGLLVGYGASAHISHFAINKHPFIGLQLFSDPKDPNITTQFTAINGIITENLIGLNNKLSNTDYGRDFQNVLLTGNNVDQDFSEITIPILDSSFFEINP